MITPMQELIEWVRNHPGQTGKSLVIDKATELLENEKEMIIKAYEDGYYADVVKSEDEFNIYYNETYNTEAK